MSQAAKSLGVFKSKLQEAQGSAGTRAALIALAAGVRMTGFGLRFC